MKRTIAILAVVAFACTGYGIDLRNSTEEPGWPICMRSDPCKGGYPGAAGPERISIGMDIHMA